MVVGGTRRVGRWVTEALLVEGIHTCAAFHDKKDEASKFAAALKASGYALNLAQADFTKEDQAKNAVMAAAEAYGGLDILVYCPGPSESGSLVGLSPKGLEHLWQVNMLGFHNAVTAAAPYLRQSQNGRIIGFATAGADSLKAYSTIPGYSATKSMLVSYCRSLAKELAPGGVTVNCIAPGITELPAEGAPDFDVEKLPSGRKVSQEHIASAIWYLISPAASQTSGSVINISGGFGL